MTERVRFSPAPTGLLHLGGARTALFNWLVARKSGGQFVLRIEDTDIERSEKRFEAAMFEDLAWLGLDWDEGPEAPGPHAPYRQSEREAVYAAFLDELREREAVYRCFCSEEELSAARARDEAARRPTRYRGKCACLPEAETESRAAAGEAFVWRFRIPPGREISWDDIVFGRLTFRSEDIGDFIVRRSDGVPTWEFASWCDDVSMGITTVIRGADHLSNTPKQLLLADVCGRERARYAHVPLVTGSGGEPLSKSAGATGVAQLRAQGYEPSAVVNHLALLGWSDPLGREVLTREEIVEAFDLGRVSTAPAEHDPGRLRWLDARHLRALGHAELVSAVAPYLPPLPAWLDRDALVEALRDGLETASDAAAAAAPVVAPLPLDAAAGAALASPAASPALELAEKLLARVSHDGERTYRELKTALAGEGLPAKEALPAVRAALTGRAHGLPIGVLFELLGGTEAARRLRAAVDSAEAGKS